MIISGANRINNGEVASNTSNRQKNVSEKFFISNVNEIEQNNEQKETISICVDPIANIEKMTGTTINCEPSYTITEEEAEYFREKYGEEYDEEHPYQLFYELVEKNIISEDDACSACDYGFFIGVESGDLNEINRQLTNGTADVWYSNYTCFKRYNEIFKSSYDKEIKTWQDIAQRKYDFFQYLIDWKDELLTPDGTKFAKSKEEMNVGFKEACNSITKVKDVLTQIFD